MSARVCAAGKLVRGAGMLALWSACAAHTPIAADQRAALNQRYHGQLVELRQSSFYGELYDENERWLLSPYPFEQTSHLVTVTGAPIHPRRQFGIVPAGTKFAVERIEFPDGWAMARRLITSPRFNPWVILRLASPDAVAQMPTKPFVWILPLDLPDVPAVDAAVAAALAPDGEISGWLAARSPAVQAAIAHKDVLVGMSRDELTAAWGPPIRRFAEHRQERTLEVAWYPAQEAWLEADRVREVMPARLLSSNTP